MTAALVDDVTHGSLHLDPIGTWTYQPDPGFTGSDTFTYRASDGVASSNLATVTISVTNNAPVAVHDATTTLHGRAAAGNVLDNDGDADADTLTAALDTDVAHGVLTLDPGGAWTYQPDPGFTGTDTVSYTHLTLPTNREV